MTTNKEKFLALVSPEDSGTLQKNKERIKNRAMLRESRQIAKKVLARLDELARTQKDLAEELGVSPQQVSKIVSGKENLTIETLVKLQEVLNIPLLATYFEDKMSQYEEKVLYSIERRIEDFRAAETAKLSFNYQETSVPTLESQPFSNAYTYREAV